MERMEDFFAARVDMYENHMLTNVRGISEAYAQMAALLPEKTAALLDLGCGTGLELAPVFARFPDAHVTGVDITRAMLDKLAQKYSSRRLTLLCGDYFTIDLGADRFDAALSFQTLHHCTHDEKRALYQKIRRALRPGGSYVEADYIANTQAAEEEGFAERERMLRGAVGEISADPKAYHIDVPCTVENQMRLLREAGFTGVRLRRRWENMALFVAARQARGGGGEAKGQAP